MGNQKKEPANFYITSFLKEQKLRTTLKLNNLLIQEMMGDGQLLFITTTKMTKSKSTPPMQNQEKATVLPKRLNHKDFPKGYPKGDISDTKTRRENVRPVQSLIDGMVQ